MNKENINNEINDIRIISIIYKTILKIKKPLIINTILITFIYTIYLFLSETFSSKYKVSQDFLIYSKIKPIEIPRKTPILVGQEIPYKEVNCIIVSHKSVYSYAKSNEFLNLFFSKINGKYPRNINNLKNNLVIGSYSNNIFSIDIVDENKSIGNSIINDFSLLLNKLLMEKSNDCNSVAIDNQNFNFRNWFNYHEIANENKPGKVLYPTIPNINPHTTYFIELPFNNNQKTISRYSKNKNFKISIIIYSIFLIAPLIYMLCFFLYKGTVLDNEGFKKLLRYKFLGTFEKKDDVFNKTLIKNNISEIETLSKGNKIGIIFLWEYNRKPIQNLFDLKNINSNFLEIDYKDLKSIRNLNNLIFVVKRFETKASVINKTNVYLELFKEKVIGYFIY